MTRSTSDATARDSAARPALPSRTTLQLARDRHFGPFLLGNLVSNLGTWMHNIAAGIVVFDLTGSAFQVGLLALAQFGPALVLAPYAGAVSDRVDRRALLIAFQTFSSLGGLGLGVWAGAVGVDGLPGVWPLHAASLLIGVGYAFSIPTHQALVASLVRPADLEGALALNTVTFNLGRALGPALGAAVLLAAGPATAFTLNGLSYLAFVAALLVVRPRPVEGGRDQGDRSLRAGFRFVAQDRVLVLLILAVAALSYAQDPVNTLAPALGEQLGGGEALVGVLVSAFGLGSVLAASTVGRLRRHSSQELLGAVGLSLLGVGMLGVAAAPTGGTALPALVLAGAGFLYAITALTARIYERVPDRLRGRVLALWGVAFLGSRPVAGLIDGAIADRFSVRTAVLLAAGVAFAAAWMVRPRAAGPRSA